MGTNNSNTDIIGGSNNNTTNQHINVINIVIGSSVDLDELVRKISGLLDDAVYLNEPVKVLKNSRK